MAEVVQVDVTLTNRERLAEGEFVTFTRHPTVLVEEGECPLLAAEQMIAAMVEPMGCMVLGSEIGGL